jgi:hypothetical protein
MKNDIMVRGYGLKIITVVAAIILVFSMLTIYINDNEGESFALLSVDEYNEVKIVRGQGAGERTILHNITVENLDGQPLLVNLYAEIIEVTYPGMIANWSVRFMHGGIEITNITLNALSSDVVGVEVNSGFTAQLSETATIRVTAEDMRASLPGPDMNATDTLQGGRLGKALILTTIRGQNYEPKIEIAPGTDNRKEVNPNNPTSYRVKVTNMGLKLDTIRLKANVGSPIRGETRQASDDWTIQFGPSALVTLNSFNEGIGSSTIVYVNVTAPAAAIYGDYPITITAVSQFGTTEDSMKIRAFVPLPDLYAEEDDITLSRFPVIDNQRMTINVTIHNDGGAVEESFSVEFWIEDSEKKGKFNIIGVVDVQPIGNGESSYAIIPLTPDLGPKIFETLTRLAIQIRIDSTSEIIEANEDNNVLHSNVEVLKTPDSGSSYSATLWMVVTMVGLAVVLTTGERYKRNRRKRQD